MQDDTRSPYDSHRMTTGKDKAKFMLHTWINPTVLPTYVLVSGQHYFCIISINCVLPNI